MKNDYKLFKKHCTKYARFLAPEYQITFEERKLDDAYAEVNYLKNNGVATIAFDKSQKQIHAERTAFHECCHLLLSRLSFEAGVFLSKSFILEMEHEIIRKLENMIFTIKEKT